ncbi:MAG: helix-turn-helix domain-containing protein [Deltaproteobacteria bacterium]|nr:helix-turn-helix domain-containing protein [Deltaproteobacteria bacterium]
MPSTSLISSIQRGLQVLEAFTPASPRMRLQEVVNRTGLPKVTVLRFLRTLAALKYITYEGDTKLYALSPRVMSLGYTALSGMDVRKVALPFLEQLSEMVGQNVNLGILDGTEIVYVERIKKKQILNIDLHVGSRLNAYNSSIGQVILAFLDEVERDSIVKELLRDPEIAILAGPRGKVLDQKLEEVRMKGYALDDEAYVAGVRAIAAPVFNHGGVVDAGINIPVFSHMVSLGDLLEKCLQPLLETADRVSAARGFLKSEMMERSL